MWLTLSPQKGLPANSSPQGLRSVARQLVEQVLAHKTGNPPADEADNYFLCAKCAQAIDARSFEQLFHHLQPEHTRLTELELTRLSLSPASPDPLFAAGVFLEATAVGEA